MTNRRALVGAITRLPAAGWLLRKLRSTAGTDDPRRFMLEMFPPRSIGAEVGVHLGDFSEQILRVVRPRSLHLVDPWRYEPTAEYQEALYGGKAREGQAEMDRRYQSVLARFRHEIRRGTIEVHRMTSVEALSRFPDAHFDWIYIDGNHRYEFVKKDVELSLVKTHSKGLVAGDDYGEGGWWAGGVKRAVDELVAGRMVELLELKNDQFVIRRRAPTPH